MGGLVGGSIGIRAFIQFDSDVIERFWYGTLADALLCLAAAMVSDKLTDGSFANLVIKIDLKT